MFKEFKDFAMRGNVIDMAVGIIIGAAFGTIVKSLVSDVIMPPIGLLLGNVDFSNLFIVLKSGAIAGPYATLADANVPVATVPAGGYARRPEDTVEIHCNTVREGQRLSSGGSASP